MYAILDRLLRRRAVLARARLGLAVQFFALGALTGGWAVHIPLVQARLEIDHATLGVGLFFAALGALVAMPTAGRLCGRFGSRKVAVIGLVLMATSLLLPLLAPSPAWLMAALFVFGATIGAADVGLNAHSVVLQIRFRRPILSSLHGGFSLGGLVGAATAGWALESGMAPVWHGALAAGATWVMVALSAGDLLARDIRRTAPPTRTHRAWLQIAPFAALAFLALMSEGAIFDWSAVFMRERFDAGPSLSGMAFAAFSLTMAANRFAGDRLSRRFGNDRLLLASGLIAAAGMTLALTAPLASVSVAGYGLAGLGLANTFPLLMGMATRRTKGPTGDMVAAISTLGYLGFLIGPPAIGGLANGIGLPAALGVVALACLIVAVAALPVARRTG